MLNIYFDNENFNQLFDVHFAERPIVPVAEMEYEETAVPGRDGKLTRELGYKNTPIPMSFNFVDLTNAKKKLREIANWLTSKKEFYFSDDTEVYRIITKLNILETRNEIKELIGFVLQIETEPFWYEDAGLVTVTDSATITNPTAISVDAKMRINGTGTCRVLLNDNQMVFTDTQGYVEIEKRNAIRNGVGQNNSMSGQYPVFVPGENQLSISGQTTSVVVDLRWAYR